MLLEGSVELSSEVRGQTSEVRRRFAMSEIEPDFNELIHRVRDSIILRRITLIFFLILVNVLRFGVKAPFSNAVSFLLVVWFLTSFIFAYLIRKQKLVSRIDSIHLGYFILEVLILTCIVHYIGAVEWVGAVFYIFPIIYANIQMTKEKGLIVGSIAIVCYISLALLEYSRIIPHKTFFPLAPNLYLDTTYVATTIGGSAGMLGLVAYTCGIFAKMLKRKSDELEEKVVERTQELTESEEKYRNLVEKSFDGIYIWQDDGFKFVNDKFEEISGYTAEELEKMDFKELVAPESLELVSEEISKRLSRERPSKHYEFVALRKGGERIDVEIYSAAINYRGKPAIQVSIRDITERKRLEDEIKTRLEEMERWHKLTVGRELKMVELKKRLKELEDRRS
ncbi:MAG: PAS domain S-box protein [Deltaproteobacteria bacterium]|jgi:PAS domain S-box-containing protein|nr:MAG: PAS domain S-box protein [Deltaproteobacteria bacterium]